MKYKNLKVSNYATVLALTTTLSLSTLSGCEKQNVSITNSKPIELIHEIGTDAILIKYNTYLYKMGSKTRLTEEAIQKIEDHTNEGTLALRLLNGEIVQVGTEYAVSKNADRGIELRLDYETELDFFTLLKSEEEQIHELCKLGDYITQNDIEKIDYTTQKQPCWSDRDSEFIRENFSEEILDCLTENGFPLPVYDVRDFYNANIYDKKRK